MKNLLPLCFLLLFLSFNCFSQKKNSVKLYNQSLDFPDAAVRMPSLKRNGFQDFNMNSFLGISYEREIRNNVGLGTQFSFWYGKSFIPDKYAGPHRMGYVTGIWFLPENIGKQTGGYNYKTFDIYALYNLQLKERVRLSLKAGPSVTTGENEYLKDVWGYYPGAECVRFEIETKKETYYGGFTGISFDYLFWQNRIPVGLDLNARYYPNFPFQLNYGLHAGFNF